MKLWPSPQTSLPLPVQFAALKFLLGHRDLQFAISDSDFLRMWGVLWLSLAYYSLPSPHASLRPPLQEESCHLIFMILVNIV